MHLSENNNQLFKMFTVTNVTIRHLKAAGKMTGDGGPHVAVLNILYTIIIVYHYELVTKGELTEP